MIRIMHVISTLDQGGAEAMLVRLLRALDPDMFSQSVISLRDRGVYGDQIEALGIPLMTLGMTGFGTGPAALHALYRAIRVQRPAIVQTWLYHADLAGLMAARMAGESAVAWNVRCATLAPGDVSRSTRLVIRMLTMLSPQPDAILFNSIAGLEAHKALGYRPRRAEVIPNGFDLDERKPDPVKRADFRAEIGVDERTFVVGMVARSHGMKDQSTFLAAAGRLKGMSRPVRFVLVGLNHTWENPSLVAEIEQYGLRNHIHLLGIRQDVPRIMAGLDCLVSTSMSEGFPNVIGEAMACGVSCVATDAGDSRLIVGDAGTILPIGDVAGVVAGVSQLMDATPAEREARSRRCRQRIIDHFDLGHIARRYAEFYAELTERRVARDARRQARREADRDRRQPVLSPPRPARVVPLDTENWHERFAQLSLDVERRRITQRTRLTRFVVALAVAYLAVFHTPLVWWTGERLTVRQAPALADAIVIFSGNGESAYVNDSYQRRARDAAGYYKAGYASLLVISSGFEQTFAEVEIIRALLLSQGVPAEAMYILPKYPSSTKQNVEFVAEVLRERRARSILFITAPYHSRRASLLWQHLAPDIAVRTVPVVDTPPDRPQWTANVDQIRAIAYEYLAIAYNRSQGWL